MSRVPVSPIQSGNTSGGKGLITVRGGWVSTGQNSVSCKESRATGAGPGWRASPKSSHPCVFQAGAATREGGGRRPHDLLPGPGAVLWGLPLLPLQGAALKAPRGLSQQLAPRCPFGAETQGRGVASRLRPLLGWGPLAWRCQEEAEVLFPSRASWGCCEEGFTICHANPSPGWRRCSERDTIQKHRSPPWTGGGRERPRAVAAAASGAHVSVGHRKHPGHRGASWASPRVRLVWPQPPVPSGSVGQPRAGLSSPGSDPRTEDAREVEGS